MPNTLPKSDHAEGLGFAAEVRVVSHRVRSAFANLASATKVDASKPRVLARDLGVDKTLAWKVSRIVTDPNPLAAITLVPGRSAQRILLDSFGRAGAGEELVERARLALETFEQMVKTHADDRETFEMMLSSVTEAGQAERDEAQRRLAFLGNSASWGVQAKARFCTYIACPTSDPDFCTTAVVGGLVNFRRLRYNIPWTLATTMWSDDEGKPMAEPPVVPLDPDIPSMDTIPLLREFCSSGLPPIRRTRRADGVAQYQIVDGEVGNTGVFTCVTGWKYQRMPKWRSEHDHVSEYAVGVTTPSELLQLDLLMHRASWPPVTPELHVFSLLPGESPHPIPGRQRPELHVCESVAPLADGLLDLDVYDIPDYGRMIESVLARMGHSRSEFVGYRVRLKHPLLSTHVSLGFPMPAKP